MKLATETIRALEGLISRYQQSLITSSIPTSVRIKNVEECLSEDDSSSITGYACTGIDIGSTNKGDDDLSSIQAASEDGIKLEKTDRYNYLHILLAVWTNFHTSASQSEQSLDPPLV